MLLIKFYWSKVTLLLLLKFVKRHISGTSGISGNNSPIPYCVMEIIWDCLRVTILMIEVAVLSR